VGLFLPATDELFIYHVTSKVTSDFTASMTWKGVHPVVEVVTTTYQTGVTLTNEAMAVVETHLTRLPHLGTWFIDFPSHPPQVWET
jgi:hypothetical protein